MNITTARLLFALAFPLSGCETKTNDAEPDVDPTLVEGVAVDAFIVMIRQDLAQPAILLFDPATGKSSPTSWPIAAGSVAIASDGQHVAWLAPATAGTWTLKTGKVVLSDGAPTFEIVNEVAGVALSQLSWTPDGDRLYTESQWIDPVAGDVHDCVYDDVGERRDPLIAIPGGHRYLCPQNAATVVMDDGVRFGTARGYGQLEAGGQLFGTRSHLPSLSYREPPTGLGFDQPYNLSGTHFDLADGRELIADRGRHGWVVVKSSGGFVDLYTRFQVTDPPLDGKAYDLVDNFADGVWQSDERWRIEDGLKPWLTDGEGRRYAPVAVTSDGKIVFSMASHVIEADTTQGTNVLSERIVETTLIEVAPDGTARGFRSSTLNKHFAYYSSESALLDRGDGDWLLPGAIFASDGTVGGFYGFIGGEATFYPRGTTSTPDGRYLYEHQQLTAETGEHCFRDLTAPKTLSCMQGPSTGAPFGFVGYGVKPEHAREAPLMTALSRGTAWTGERVTIHGAHFGGSGSVTVGEATVATSDVAAWSDNRITFVMSESLSAGRVRVTTAAGTGGDQRAFMLGRVARLETPFDDVRTGVVPLAQGHNLLDLGELPDGFTTAQGYDGNTRLSPDNRLADGRYVVYGDGADAPTLAPVTLSVAGYERILPFELQDAIADPSAWQLVSNQRVVDTQRHAFVTLAGDLVERANRLHPVLDGRVTFAQVKQRLPFGGAIELGMPDFFRHDGDLTWTSNKFSDGPAVYPGWGVRLLTGWVGADGIWGTPVYDASRRIDLPYYFRGVAADGELMLFTGLDPLGEAGGAYILSSDGGRTLGPPVLVPEEILPGKGALQQPFYVASGDGFFLVFEASYNGGVLLGVHAIDRLGALTPNVTPLPPHVQLVGQVDDLPPLFATHGGKVLMHISVTSTLLSVDFDAAGEPSWSVVPAAADVGNVHSLYHDRDSDDVYAVRRDGSIARATVAGGWKDWAPFDLAITLPLPTRAEPLALGKLPNGQWIIVAQLYDGSPGAAAGTPSPLAQSGWLIGPTP